MTRYSFVRALVEDPDHPGEVLLDLGDELCEQLGWKPGDTLVWKDNLDGTWTLSKAPATDVNNNKQSST
jgi:hypothetical protein